MTDALLELIQHLQEVDHVQGMTHFIDGSPARVSLWVDDELLERMEQ